MILAVVDDVTRAHLAAAIAAHQAALRRNGIPVPASVRELAQALAKDGQARPAFDDNGEPGDAGPMEKLAVDYRDAGAMVGVSDRTVRRLVQRGDLPAVDLAGCRRIRVADLVAYAASLPTVRANGETP